ncbi:hypothetical protein PYJP_03530 [Pyrofollis japonicus]|nr:hypothetical protein PYJP_03530 [Pyrofollis japonicus]
MEPKYNMVFRKDPTDPPFEMRATSPRDLSACFTLIAKFLSYRDTPPYILLMQVIDGLPGLFTLFCKHLLNTEIVRKMLEFEKA